MSNSHTLLITCQHAGTVPFRKHGFMWPFASAKRLQGSLQRVADCRGAPARAAIASYLGAAAGWLPFGMHVHVQQLMQEVMTTSLYMSGLENEFMCQTLHLQVVDSTSTSVHKHAGLCYVVYWSVLISLHLICEIAHDGQCQLASWQPIGGSMEGKLGLLMPMTCVCMCARTTMLVGHCCI